MWNSGSWSSSGWNSDGRTRNAAAAASSATSAADWADSSSAWNSKRNSDTAWRPQVPSRPGKTTSPALETSAALQELLQGLSFDVLREAEEVFQIHRKHEETLARQELELAAVTERKRALMRRYAQLDERCRALADTSGNKGSSSSRCSPPLYNGSSCTNGPAMEAAALPSCAKQQQQQQQVQQHRTQLAPSVSTTPTFAQVLQHRNQLASPVSTTPAIAQYDSSTVTAADEAAGHRYNPSAPTAREKKEEGTHTTKKKEEGTHTAKQQQRQLQQQQQQQSPWLTCVGCGKEGLNGLWAVVADCNSFVYKLQKEDIFDDVMGNHSGPCETWQSLAACLVQEAHGRVNSGGAT